MLYYIITSRLLVGLVVLPVEIFHREFDAKLWLAVQLAQINKHIVIFGYDKQIIPLLPQLQSCCLLDKSCSTLMVFTHISCCI